MSPRVLFVSRERVRLPLDGAQKRKWDAVAEVLDLRVLAAAPPGRPTRDARFHLVGPASPHTLDGLLYYLLLPWRIARELRGFRPDAAVVQGVHEMIAFLIARRLAGSHAKAILDVQGDWHGTTRLYGSPLRRLLNPLNDALAPAAVRGADAVRTVSTQTTELVTDLGVRPASVFPSYVDAEAFLTVPPAPLPDRPNVLFVGVLERIKAFDTLVAAWRVVAASVPEATLHIVGRGSLELLARRTVDGSDGRVEWAEHLTPAEVATAMDGAWVLALPSRSEGLPRVAVEVACRGRAIVGGNRGGIPDVVKHGENGLLVDPDDAADLAGALVRILSDRAYAARLGDAARGTGEEWGISAPEYAAKLHALVEHALSGSDAGPRSR